MAPIIYVICARIVEAVWKVGFRKNWLLLTKMAPARTWRFDLNPGPGEGTKDLARPLGFNPGALIEVNKNGKTGIRQASGVVVVLSEHQPRASLIILFDHKVSSLSFVMASAGS